jgi:Fic family protein
VAAFLRDGSPKTADAGAALGYLAGMDHDELRTASLLEPDDLRRLNAIVLGSPSGAGELSGWRKKPHHREAFDAEGHATGLVFTTLPPRMIASGTEDLLTWLEYELRSAEHHPTVVIGAFILGLLSISPFRRGNARLCRLLIGKLLRRAGYDYMRLVSVEREIEILRDTYHQTFHHAHTGIWSGEADLGSWLRFFLEVLERHQEKLEAMLKSERAAIRLSPLQHSILRTVREHGEVGAGLLLEATGANRNTLKDNLRRLVDHGMLSKSGQRRGTRYRLPATESRDKAES